MRTVLGFLVLAAATLATAQASSQPAGPYATPQRLVTLADGRRINLYCTGQGAPTVVLDAGLGMGMAAWSKVQPELAKTTRVCAYDRAGYGFSDPGPLPRNAVNLVADLKAALAAGGERGPFVIVAHSMSGFTARYWSETERKDVAGVVLVDPNFDGDRAALGAAGPTWAQAVAKQEAGAVRCMRAAIAGRMKPGAPEYAECGSPPAGSPGASRDMAAAVLSEFENLAASEREVRAAGPLPAYLPIIVLTGGARFGPSEGATPAETTALMKTTVAGHDAIAAQSRRGSQRTVADAPHMIHYFKPEAVIAAVEEVVAMARSDAAPVPR